MDGTEARGKAASGLSGRSTFELFSSPYLDSEWDEPGEVRRELARRGFVGPLRWLVHLVVFLPGFGWNALWWEWTPGSLDGFLLAFGWSLTLTYVAGVGGLVAGAVVIGAGGKGTVLVAGALALAVGLMLQGVLWLYVKRLQRRGNPDSHVGPRV